MTYSIYGRMSKDSASRDGAWYCLKTNVPVDKVEELMQYYSKTWRYIERREECFVGGKKENSDWSEHQNGQSTGLIREQ